MDTTDSSAPDRLEKYIIKQKGHLPSSRSMVLLANWLYENKYFENNNQNISTNDINDGVGESLEYRVDTVLDNLKDIDVVNEVSRGGGQYVLHERTGSIFFNPNVDEVVELLDEEVSRFLKDLHEQDQQFAESEDIIDEQNRSLADGGKDRQATNQDDLNSTEESNSDNDENEVRPTTLRSVATEVLEIHEARLEEYLTEPEDHIEKMGRYDNIVNAIIVNDEVERGYRYEPMGWRNPPNKWVLTTVAKARKENRSLFD